MPNCASGEATHLASSEAKKSFSVVSFSDIMSKNMSRKHLDTLLSIFATPVKSNIGWIDIEKMLVALGADISEGRGSRVRIKLKDVRAVFHRPHPRKETDKGAVVSVRRFLMTAGITPEENNL